MPGPNIHLVLQSTSGHWQHPFSPTDTGQQVLNAAIEHWHLQTGPNISYRLLKDGSALALGETLEELGLRDGDVLTVQPSQAQDG